MEFGSIDRYQMAWHLFLRPSPTVQRPEVPTGHEHNAGNLSTFIGTSLDATISTNPIRVTGTKAAGHILRKAFTSDSHYSGVGSERIARSLGSSLRNLSTFSAPPTVRLSPQSIYKLVANVPGNSIPVLLYNLWALGNRVGEHACLLAAQRLCLVGKVHDGLDLIRCLPIVNDKRYATTTISLILRMREHWKADITINAIFEELSRLNLSATVTMYNALISAAINCNDHELVHRTYHTLLRSGLEPSESTFGLLVKYNRKIGNIMEERNVLQWCVKSRGSLPSSVAWAILQALHKEKKSYNVLRSAYQSLYSVYAPDPFALFNLDVDHKLSLEQARPAKILLISYLRSIGSSKAVVEQYIRKVLLEGRLLNNIARTDLIEALIIVLRHQTGASGTVLLLARWLSSQAFGYSQRLETKKVWEMTISVLLAADECEAAEQVLGRLLKEQMFPSLKTWHIFVSHYFSSDTGGRRTAAGILERIHSLGVEKHTAFGILNSYTTAVSNIA
ncbi:hypothetical protein BJ508DRAFT_306213 [Ascobolus immersus RN42]|uniref:Pentacotripeptide-repeat region of PRORP domain-containing protein n=1 Tax=Ascobolus immersus RN42 TaxID=1160509 RepID=A0A3N4IC97_ASCIM|nr:hypothetical protein BJ508DRAFT_306213 [Ascobolus immersus RN42]